MNSSQRTLLDKLNTDHRLSLQEYETVIRGMDAEVRAFAAELAVSRRKQLYGTDVYVRGLIEFTSYCKNDCLYCGLRRSNTKAERYRLMPEEIFACCREGYRLGFRTFVLQGGEDPYYTDDRMAGLVREIRRNWPDCAITLSLGERTRESYQILFDAGADRYLLRHETADPAHYAKLHPRELSWAHRMQCLQDLKEIGYQTGCGFMVGSPHQTAHELAEDLFFIQTFQPAMCGIGPFISHRDTPFAGQPSGTLDMTLYLLSLLRLIKPDLLLPATTALGTIHPRGRELGIEAGANVVMPNLSPTGVRDKYLLYDNKICTGEESAQCVGCLEARMQSIGYTIVQSRGDPADHRSGRISDR